jgi:hypothetical protein
MSDLFIGATKDIGGLAPLHNFTVEPEVIGVFSNISPAAGQHETPLYVFTKEDKSQFAVWGSYQIKQFMAKHSLGDKVGFAFKGETELENGNKVKNYDCYSF